MKRLRNLIPTESDEQIALIDWANITRAPNGNFIGKYLIKIPNEGKRSVQMGQRYKREGLKKGVSDLFLAYPIEPYWHGLWMEGKAPNFNLAKMPKEQLEWLSWMADRNYAIGIFKGWEDGAQMIRDYLGLKNDFSHECFDKGLLKIYVNKCLEGI